MNLGTGGLTKTDAGTLTLAVANTYSGATNINGGTVVLAAPGALSTTSAVNVASGASLGLTGGYTYGVTAALLTLNGNAANVVGTGALDNISGTNTYAGQIALGSNATISSDAGTPEHHQRQCHHRRRLRL